MPTTISFTEDLTTSDWIQLISAALVFFGLAINAWQVRVSSRKLRGERFWDIFHSFLGDENIHVVYRLIEYDTFEFGSDFHGSDEEVKIDIILDNLNVICYMREQGFISEEEVRFFDYYISRVMRNSEIEKYLDFLEDWRKRYGHDREIFFYVRRYWKKHKNRLSKQWT